MPVLLPAIQNTEVRDAVSPELWRRVARYARGADYHDFLLERLSDQVA